MAAIGSVWAPDTWASSGGWAANTWGPAEAALAATPDLEIVVRADVHDITVQADASTITIGEPV